MKQENGEGEMERYDMITANTLSHACTRCLYVKTRRNCGSLRECDIDTVTDDTNAQMENVTPVTLGVTFARDQRKNKKTSVDGGGIRFDVFFSSKFASAGRYWWKTEKIPQIRTEHFLTNI